MKARLNLGYGTGNPVSAPDFRPLNPWGRPMPKPDRPPRPDLYQVIVTDNRTRETIRVGPRGPAEVVHALRIAISQQIALGIERDWSAPATIKIL